MKCAQCGSNHPFRAYMGYPIFSGYWCDNCEEFTATCNRMLLWFVEFFVAPWVDGFAICVSDQRIAEQAISMLDAKKTTAGDGGNRQTSLFE